MRLAGVEMVHVPYKGGGPSVQSVLAGDTQLAFATPPSVLPLVQAGRLRALAVTSRDAHAARARRARAWPKRACPTTRFRSGTASSSRAGTPADAVKKLFAATEQVLRLPEIAKTLAREGTETSSSASPEDFGAFLRSGRETVAAPGAGVGRQGGLE